MKRSEMVSLLAETMYSSFQGEQTFRQLADKIINFVEEQGMLPPVKKNCPITLRTEHIWEDENVS